MLEDNGPLINDDGDQTSNVLIDGGGETFVLTKEKTKCANVQRSFTNEDTCFLSTSSMTCSASQPIGEIPIVLDANTIKVFYNESEKYVYAVR
jgi:sucrose-6-phosphate hydrolase SacC (GH32 family)